MDPFTQDEMSSIIDDNWIDIFSFLNVYDFLNIRITCKNLHNLTNETKQVRININYWKYHSSLLCKHINFNAKSNKFNFKTDNWYQFYISLTDFLIKSKLVPFEKKKTLLKFNYKISKSGKKHHKYNKFEFPVTIKDSINGSDTILTACDQDNLLIFKLLLTTNNFTEKDIPDKIFNSRLSGKCTLFWYGCGVGSINIIDYLLNVLKLPIDVSSNPKQMGRKKATPLWVACCQRNVQIVSLLINHSSMTKIGMNRYHRRAYTPFHIACMYRDYDDIIRYNYNVHALKMGHKSKESFEKAAVDIASLLMKNEHVDVNKQNYVGETPLMSVLYRHEKYDSTLYLDLDDDDDDDDDYKEMNINLAKLLIGNDKIDVNCQDGSQKHNTVLHKCIENDNIECIKMLLKRNDIDVNIKNGNGDTPLQLAKKCHNDEIKQLFDEYRKS